jgi:hypothetical protein
LAGRCCNIPSLLRVSSAATSGNRSAPARGKVESRPTARAPSRSNITFGVIAAVVSRPLLGHEPDLLLVRILALEIADEVLHGRGGRSAPISHRAGKTWAFDVLYRFASGCWNSASTSSVNSSFSTRYTSGRLTARVVQIPAANQMRPLTVLKDKRIAHS